MPTVQKLPGKFAETEIDDEMVIMHLDTGVFFSVDQTALAIWHLLDSVHDVPTLVSTLEEKFDISADECEEQVTQFVENLKEKGLVSVD